MIVPALDHSCWPGDEDVKRAFRVFDSEGLGFIKVTLLKRFLVQAQLGVEDAVCKLNFTGVLYMYRMSVLTIVEQLIREHCHIDGDDLINYEGININFISRSVMYRYNVLMQILSAVFDITTHSHLPYHAITSRQY